MAIALGAQDESRFDIRQALGSGGMGTVYRAFDRRLGREVALKILRQATGRDLYRFKREFRLLADMSHPNLVSLYELHTSGDEWFFTMELVEGVSFLEWVRPGVGPLASSAPSGPHATAPSASHPITGPDEDTVGDEPHLAAPVTATAPVPRIAVATRLDEQRLRAALPQLVEGVMALHVAGKLHRDLKPSNVLVRGDGRVALLDFGLVSDVQTMHVERTHEAAAVGTPSYMSPEQAADLPLSESSDWYSVGVMLYEALTGRRPFMGSAEAQMTRKQQELPPAPREVATGVPDDLDRLAVQLLSIAPERRPAGRGILKALALEPSSAFVTLERMAVARPFVGRTAELAALRAAAATAADHAVAVFVSGESGIGKSQLVRQFLDELAGAAIILEGRCYERESVPYKTLDTVVDALTGVLIGLPDTRLQGVPSSDLAALARLFPVLRRVPAVTARTLAVSLPLSPIELRSRAFAALRTLLGLLAATSRLVITIDDLQWGDADSAVFLADLVHDPDPLPLLLVLTHRPEDDAGLVARVRSAKGGPEGDVRTIAVGPLAEAEARRLVKLVGASDVTSDRLIRDGGGHPLFLAELARTARRSQDVPTSFESLIAHRVDALPTPAASLLRTAAVAARPLPIDLAAQAAGITLDGTEIAVLRSERLLRARHRGETELEHVETYHDRVRHAVVAALTPDALAAVHTSLARAYEASERREDLEAVIAHWTAAGQPRRAAGFAVDAARFAEESLAFHRAAALYELALTHGDHDEAARRRLHRRHGEALVSCGRLAEAAAEFAIAAQGADPEETLELDRLRLGQLLRRGLVDQGRDLSRQMLAPLGIAIPRARGASIRSLVFQSVRNRLRGLSFVERPESEIPRDVLHKIDLLATTATALGIGEPVVGRIVQSHCLRAALDAGEPRRICMALAIELGYRGQVGNHNQRRIDEALAVLRPLAERIDSPSARSLAAVMQGFLNFQLGRWKESRLLLETGLAMMREHVAGVRWELTVNEQVHVSALSYLGEVREVLRLVPRLYREAIDRGDSYAQDGMRGWRGNVAWLYAGKLDEARQHAAEVRAPLPAPENISIRHMNELVARVQVQLYAGDASAAKASIDDTWPTMASSLLFRVQLLRIEGNLLRGRALAAYAMVSTGDQRAAALKTLRRIVKELAAERAPWAAAIAEMLRGLIARMDGDDTAAAACLEAAERGFLGADMGLHAEAVRLRRGQLEGGTTGDARVNAAMAAMRETGLVDPAAIARMICPWPE